MRPGVLRWWLIASLLLPAGACQRAGRYQRPSPSIKDDKKAFPGGWAWLEPHPTRDIPIRFVPDTNPAWPGLPAFWNIVPPPGAGQATIHVGLSPMSAVAAIALVGHLEMVQIKVPRGLPDPTPSIPEASPPTLGKWELGRRLFFEPFYKLSQFTTWSCATCHDPAQGFTGKQEIKALSKRNTLSLINCVYNKRQFWDGRVRDLEQVIVRDLKDEGLDNDARPVRHIWAGLVEHVRNDPEYRRRFQDVFGIHHPTQDAIAKALATYMRTLLSGASVYDLARAERSRRGETDVSASHFEAVLDDSALTGLGQRSKADAARQLAHGYQLFHGKARCQHCHPAPLFTDHDFHNIGLDPDVDRLIGLDDPELGRFAQVPIGLKEARLRGAFRTPTLRALPRTGPYMHDGRFHSLNEVVAHFNHQIEAWSNSYVASELLLKKGQARRLDLDDSEVADLVLFLRALDGEALDPRVLAPPEKK